MGYPTRIAMVVALSAAACHGDSPSFEPGRPWDGGSSGGGASSSEGDEGSSGNSGETEEPPKIDCDPEAWASGWIRPQHEMPVLASDLSWESAGLRPSEVVWDGSRLRAFYVGQTLEECFVGTWHATCAVGRLGTISPDSGSGWSRGAVIPVLDLWDEHQLSVKRGEVLPPDQSRTGLWEAWFGVEGVDLDARIYHATSSDGVNWSPEIDAGPVLGAGAPGSWESRGVTDPKVGRVEGRWMMWYAGFAGPYARPQIGAVVYDEDEVRWKRVTQGPVFPAGASGRFDAWGVSAPAILHFDECLVMFYTARASAEDRGSIGVATSEDGYIWQRSREPVLRSGEADWESAGVFDATVWQHDGEVRMLYRGFNEYTPGGLGYALMD